MKLEIIKTHYWDVCYFYKGIGEVLLAPLSASLSDS